MSARASVYHISLRLYVLLSVLMAVTATATGLLLLYLARPFVAPVGGQQALEAIFLLFSGAMVAGAVAAIGGLILGLRFAARIRGIVEKADALALSGVGGPKLRVVDELGALDAAVGRLTLSMNQFVRDSDILGRLPEGMLLLRPGGEMLSFNAAAEALLEMQLEPFRGIPVLSLAGALPLAKGNEALARLLTEATTDRRTVQQGEVVAVSASGQLLLLEVTVQYREWRRDSTALVLLFRDASEKQRIREEIRRADQLAFLGGMAAHVAHEIRTPLATIRGLLELLQSDLAEMDSRREYIARTLVAVERQDRLVEDLLTLSNPEPEAWQAIPIGTLLDDVLAMLPPDARLHRTGDGGALPPVWGDAFRLSQVFANLIQNALEAAPPSGRVDLRVEPTDREWVRVSVRNTGPSIPPELRERIFQPFFTTKARGTGLGLAIARQIVDAHRGELRLASDDGSETTFIVELPTTPPSGAADEPGRREIVERAHG